MKYALLITIMALQVYAINRPQPAPRPPVEAEPQVIIIVEQYESLEDLMLGAR